MKVQFSLVGHMGNNPNITVNLDAVPRVGDVINWPGLSQAETYVRTVVWYPTHDDDNEPLDEPFVYVVVGRDRGDPGPSRLERYLHAPREGET